MLHPMADPEGGIKMEDKTNVLPGVVANLVKQLAKKAMSGKFGDILSITSPAKFHSPLTHLSCIENDFAHCH